MVDKMKIKMECAVCPIRIWDDSTDKIKKTSEYNEVDVDLSNGSRMTVGVCSKHASLNAADLPKVTEKIHQGWLEELSLGIGNTEWIENEGLKLKIVGVQ